MENNALKFRVNVIGVPEEGETPVPLFETMAAFTDSWVQTEYEEEEQDEEDEEMVVATGCIDFYTTMNSAAFKEYATYDPEQFSELKVIITYEENGIPVFCHAYSCDPTFDLLQDAGSVEDEKLVLTLSFDYYACNKFVEPVMDGQLTH